MSPAHEGALGGRGNPDVSLLVFVRSRRRWQQSSLVQQYRARRDMISRLTAECRSVCLSGAGSPAWPVVCSVLVCWKKWNLLPGLFLPARGLLCPSRSRTVSLGGEWTTPSPLRTWSAGILTYLATRLSPLPFIVDRDNEGRSPL